MLAWDKNYQLQFSDFQSPATQVGQGSNYSIYSTASFDYSFYMLQAEFMFTKNFNSKVNCSFQRNASSIVAVDSTMAYQLLNFGRYSFDLAELYARKFRKKIYEEKTAFSDVSFCKPIYEEMSQALNTQHAFAARQCDLGRNEEKLKQLHGEILKEIEMLSDFCKTCKPPKKKK
ncbi:hypothetical protein CNR22_10575 [Sphingobacteriaceae bacterium]|nr:hypothetical protein CNR22_10575 [Sphingobacteriaceae bacterium]